MERTQSYTTGAILSMLLLIDLVIAVASWYLPADAQLVRNVMAGIQLTFLAVTGLVTLRWAVRDF